MLLNAYFAKPEILPNNCPKTQSFLYQSTFGERERVRAPGYDEMVEQLDVDQRQSLLQ